MATMFKNVCLWGIEVKLRVYQSKVFAIESIAIAAAAAPYQLAKIQFFFLDSNYKVQM